MQITHAEAIRLIQFSADKALPFKQEKILLDEHLQECSECRAYVNQLNEMENVLQSVLRKQWNLHPAPLIINTLTGKEKGKKNQGALLITRNAIISIAFLAFVLIGWQFTLSAKSNNGVQPGLLPIPTPSALFTATSFPSQNCSNTEYQVQKNDTLDSIADHFSTSKERLMSLNHLYTETIDPATKLLIPICELTPTTTTHPPTFTITPFLQPITYTPG